MEGASVLLKLTVIEVRVCTVNLTRSFSLSASEISTIKVFSGICASCSDPLFSPSALITLSGACFSGLPEPESSSPS